MKKNKEDENKLKDYKVSIQEFRYYEDSDTEEAPVYHYIVKAKNEVDAMFCGMELFQKVFEKQKGEKYMVKALEVSC